MPLCIRVVVFFFFFRLVGIRYYKCTYSNCARYPLAIAALTKIQNIATASKAAANQYLNTTPLIKFVNKFVMHIKNYTRMTCPCVCVRALACPGWLAVCAGVSARARDLTHAVHIFGSANSIVRWIVNMASIVFFAQNHLIHTISLCMNMIGAIEIALETLKELNFSAHNHTICSLQSFWDYEWNQCERVKRA